MSRIITIGKIKIGGDNRVAIQSMTNTKTCDIESTVSQIKQLEDCGCDIIRLAVKDKNDAIAIKSIIENVTCPLVADIHFDYKLAITAIENGINKVRINPGNIGKMQNVEKLVACAKMHKTPIRIGVNSGSIEKSIKERLGVCTEAIVESAMQHIQILEQLSFYDIAVSVKSSSVKDTIDSYRALSKIIDYPLHLGVTEAGTYENSLVKSSIAIGSLLLDGIGDTIRVSITGEPTQEIFAAKRILRAAGIDKNYVEVIACPTCGRCEVPLFDIATQIEKATANMTKPLKVAVMGCVVNGIGEGQTADIGLAGGKDCGIIFKKGQIIEKVQASEMVSRLIKIIEEM